MSIVSELVALPGVFAAGEYSYRGDRYTYKGSLSNEQARMASIMCRATTMSVHMQAAILQPFCEDCKFSPVRGWVVQGPRYAVCVVANVFCFVTDKSALTPALRLLQTRLADADDDLV